MHITCQGCGGQALPLLRTDDAIENVCVNCGAVTTTPAKIAHDREMMPHQPKNWEKEADKIARLRALRLAQGSRRRAKFGRSCTIGD
jgi:hypothetical protein